MCFPCSLVLSFPKVAELLFLKKVTCLLFNDNKWQQKYCNKKIIKITADVSTQIAYYY